MLTRKKPLFKSWVYNPDIIDEDIYAIKSLYLKHGFLDAQVDKKEVWDNNKRRATLIIHIDEGPQTIVKDIQISSTIEVQDKKIKKSLHHKIGKPLQKYMIKTDENTIAAIISENGYPHAVVTCDIDMKNESREAYLLFKIKEGPFVKMGKAYFWFLKKTITIMVF